MSFHRFFLVGCIALAASCGKQVNDTVTVDGSRKIDAEKEPAPLLGASGSQRFPMMGSAVSQGPLKYTVPATWKNMPTSGGMRIADFRIGPNDEGECYLSYLPGNAGGTAANVNRWREQLGLENFSEEQVASLQPIEMLGGSAAFVDFTGAYKGMGASEAKEGSRLLGAVLPLGEMTLFVKMIGPEPLVGKERDPFIRFCRSLQFNKEESSGP